MNIVIYIAEIAFLALLTRSLTSRFFGILLKATGSKRLSTLIVWLMFLPGVFIHETAHFLTAVILRVPVGRFDLMPTLEEKGMKLGSVSIAKTDIIRRQIIGFAPFIVGNLILVGAFYIFWEYKLENDIVASLLSLFTAFEIGNTMFSSKKDLEGTGLLFLLVSLIAGILMYLSQDKTYFIYVFEALNNSKALNMLVFTMFVPISINVGVIFFFSLLEKGFGQVRKVR